jgi:hypothetical protein
MFLSAADWEYVDERASGFSGRRWVFKRLHTHLSGPPRCLAISGPPGTGKTALSAVIAQRAAGRSPESGPAAAIAAFPVHAAYFCRDGRVDLLDCAQQLADQLVAALPPFAEAAQSALAADIKTGDVVVHVEGSVAAGASVAGVRIVLDHLGPERAFSRGVALPLRRLRAQFDGQVVILVDGLDETIARPEASGLPELLSKLEGVHLVVTTRRDRRVLQYFDDSAARLDLLDDAPPDVDDVLVYAAGRLAVIRDEDARSALAARIASAADGNFLYAQHVTAAIAADPATAAMDRRAAGALELPEGRLPGVYRAFLRREMGRDETLWSTRFAPVLGTIAVSFGEGLTSTALAAIASRYSRRSFSQQNVRDITKSCYQFLEGPRPDGPFRVYHKSFADFLVEPADNPDYSLEPGEIHRTIVATLGARPRSEWGWPSYEWRHLFRHAHAAGAASHDFTELFNLADSGFLEEGLAATGDLPAVAAGFELLFDVCAATDDVSRCAAYAHRRQDALRLQREITQTPGLMALRLHGLAPEERAAAAERLSSATVLIPDALQRASALLSLYEHAARDLAGTRALTQLPRAVVDAVKALPSSSEKSRVHAKLIAAVAVCEPDRASWVESLDLEPSVPEVSCADLAQGYLRAGDQASAFRLLRRAIVEAGDPFGFVTLEPQQLLAATSQLADPSSLEDLLAAATSKAGRPGVRARARVMRIGLLAQLGREEDAAAELDVRLQTLASAIRDADDDAKWRLALGVSTAAEALPHFRDDAIRSRLERAVAAIARALPDNGRQLVADYLASALALCVETQRLDAGVALGSVARLGVQPGRHRDVTQTVIEMIQRCTTADARGPLLDLLESLSVTTEPNDRASCVAAAIIALVRCGDEATARAWCEREGSQVDATRAVKPETPAALAAAVAALGAPDLAASRVQRAFADWSVVKDAPDSDWGLEALLKASDLMPDSPVRLFYYHELLQAATISPTRTTIVSEVCLRARDRLSLADQRAVGDAAERALAQPRATPGAVSALAAAIRTFATAGAQQQAAEGMRSARGWFHGVKHDADTPAMYDALLRINHPALARDVFGFLIREVTATSSAYYAARSLATLLLHADGYLGDEEDEAARLLIVRIDQEVEGLNRVDALGLLAGAGAAVWEARHLPLVERIDDLVARGKPNRGDDGIAALGWLSARANCSLAYVACGSRDRAARLLNDTLGDAVMDEWVEQSDWSDRPAELVRAVLAIDAETVSLPTLARLARLVERQQCAASRTAGVIAEVLTGGALVPWDDPRALRLQPSARQSALETAETLTAAARQEGFSGPDADVIRYSVASAEALIAKAYAEGGDPDRADRIIAAAVERLADIGDEQSRSWSLSSLVSECPAGLAQRRSLEARVRDAIHTIGNPDTRSDLARAYLESTPFERIGRLSEWLGHLGSRHSANDFAKTVSALLRRESIPPSAHHDLLKAAAIREPEDLLLVTAEVARTAPGECRAALLERLCELLGFVDSRHSHSSSGYRAGNAWPEAPDAQAAGGGR